MQRTRNPGLGTTIGGAGTAVLDAGSGVRLEVSPGSVPGGPVSATADLATLDRLGALPGEHANAAFGVRIHPLRSERLVGGHRRRANVRGHGDQPGKQTRAPVAADLGHGVGLTPRQALGTRTVEGSDPLQRQGRRYGRIAKVRHRRGQAAGPADRSILGKTIRLDARSATIVGVLEPSVPYPAETELIANVVTSPHHLSATMVTGREHRMTEVFARLAPGATVDGARAETVDSYAAVRSEHAAAYPAPARFQIGLVPLRDQLTANAGARYRLPLGDWTGEAALQLSYSTLDSEGFESKRMLLLQATRALSEEWRLRARYRYSDIDGLDGFEGLDGYRHELGIRGVWRRDQWDVSLEYRYDNSDYADENLSFDRHQLTADVQRELGENWTVQAGLSFDRSRYDVAANGTEERFETRILISASPRLPPRTTRLKLPLVSGPNGSTLSPLR